MGNVGFSRRTIPLITCHNVKLVQYSFIYTWAVFLVTFQSISFITSARVVTARVSTSVFAAQVRVERTFVYICEEINNFRLYFQQFSWLPPKWHHDRETYLKVYLLPHTTASIGLNYKVLKRLGLMPRFWRPNSLWGIAGNENLWVTWFAYLRKTNSAH